MAVCRLIDGTFSPVSIQEADRERKIFYFFIDNDQFRAFRLQIIVTFLDFETKRTSRQKCYLFFNGLWDHKKRFRSKPFLFFIFTTFPDDSLQHF